MKVTKKQLQELNGQSDDLQKELISKAIEAIAYNASVTLDGRHDDKTPLELIVEKFKFDELSKSIDGKHPVKSS